MQTRKLGNSDLAITPIGVGAWAMGGGDWAFSWGHQEDQQSIAAIHAALDAGVNWIDTAAIYGLGHSEEVVGKAIAGRSKRPYVFTKCGLVWNEQREISRSLKADSVRRELEASLRRLRVDAIDLYQIHWPDPEPEIEEGWQALAQAQKEGKVRWIGVSNFSVAQMKRAQPIAPITSLQPPYNIVTADIEKEILPYCRQNNIGVIVYSPMKSGLLTGKMTRERIAKLPPDDFRPRTPSFKEPLLTRNLGLVEVLRKIGERHNHTPGEVAIAWALRDPVVTGAIVGMRSAEQAKEVLRAAEFRLSADEIGEIEGYLRANPVAA
ncbi:MAG TPA: aldo/keto reductase [Candidatus Limnocylindrales bacterium]|jgi:aryl-alcohol dehydrogenase-like predicted oxidoreductase|nr:aldo/keto reductase [Candidatus Limnocylindrales bacterium]